MMRGRVDFDLEAIIEITVIDSNGVEQDFCAKIDTGFTGDLSVPELWAQHLKFDLIGHGIGKMADDSLKEHPVYAALVRWHGGEWYRKVRVLGSEVLIGTGLLNESKLEIEYVPNGEVKVSRMK